MRWLKRILNLCRHSWVPLTSEPETIFTTTKGIDYTFYCKCEKCGKYDIIMFHSKTEK